MKCADSHVVDGDNRALHLKLASLNASRYAPSLPYDRDWRADLKHQFELALVEAEYLENERARIAERAATAPQRPLEFVRWFERLKLDGPGQHDPLFPWLAENASLEQMQWFLTQEIAGEAGFEDLTALTQVRFPPRPKLEMARNYWDEMGRGRPSGMHGPMLEQLGRALGLEPDAATSVWESLALANTMAGLAANRRYAYHSVGALGVIEMTAPSRAAAVAKGLNRLGVPQGDRHYFDLHSILDVKHSLSWNAECIVPLVEDMPECATALAEGALMRLEAGRRCFERYRAHFGVAAHTRPGETGSRRFNASTAA
jgi:pyrroloquinoline quinone (PQQ) biosynthesis protein C